MRFLGSRILFVFISLALSACVTVHVSDPVVDPANTIAVSCAPTQIVHEGVFRLVSCTIENRTQDWATLKVKSFQFTGPEHSVRILNPKETRDFYLAYESKSQMDRENQKVAAGLVAMVGLAAAIVGTGHGSNGLELSGSAAFIAGEAVVAGSRIKEQHDAAQYGYRFGDDHLLFEGDIRIPANMFVRKSILVEVTDFSQPPTGSRLCFDTMCLDIPIPGKLEPSRINGKHPRSAWD